MRSESLPGRGDVPLRDADAPVIERNAEALQEIVPHEDIHVRSDHRIQHIARRVFLEVLFVVAELHQAPAQQALLKHSVVSMFRVDQRGRLADYRIGLGLREMRKGSSVLQYGIEVRRDGSDLLDARGAAAVAACLLPLLLNRPALWVLPLTPIPLFALDTWALALGTPRTGPPACARS